jgi:hypothetical protein
MHHNIVSLPHHPYPSGGRSANPGTSITALPPYQPAPTLTCPGSKSSLYSLGPKAYGQETYIFPILAKKMPQFKAGAREQGEHLKSHKAIHVGMSPCATRTWLVVLHTLADLVQGLDKYNAFLKATLAEPSSYNPTQLREIMDGFREVLFRSVSVCHTNHPLDIVFRISDNPHIDFDSLVSLSFPSVAQHSCLRTNQMLSV